MNIRLEPSNDWKIIDSVIRHEDVFDMSSDDAAPDPPRFTAEGSGMLFVLVYGDDTLGGLYALHFHSTVMAEIHTCLLRPFRGRPARESARMIIEWAFTQTSCRKLITLVPTFNRGALFYAMQAGLIREGVIVRSFLKGGQMHDQILLGICKGDAPCQS